MKQYDQILEDEACVVKHEVETIRSRLGQIAGDLEKNFMDERKIFDGINEINHNQSDFNERVRKISEKLNHYKSILALLRS